MKLYHFTGVAMLHSILTSEGINKGYFQLSDGKMLYVHSWYTSYPLPYGHGLVDGTEVLTKTDKDFLLKAGGQDASSPIRGTHNKRLIRLTVDSAWLKQQDTFYPFKKLLREYQQPTLWGTVLGIQGWVKTESLSDSELKCQQQSNFDPPLFNNSSCNLGLPQLRWSCLSQRAHDSSSQ